MMTSVQKLTAKRLRGELEKLRKEPETYYQIVQDEQDQLLFYFLLRGASDSIYKNGYYIGKIVLSKDYPASPGDFYMLTPSGRFSINTKICLTNTGFHKESWTPIWNISNMVIALISVFLSDTTSGISHIKETSVERETKATNSMQYNFTNHKDICLKFDQFVKPDNTTRTDKEVEELVQTKIGKLKKNKKEKKIKDDTTKTEPIPNVDIDVKTISVETKTEPIPNIVETKINTENGNVLNPQTSFESKCDDINKPISYEKWKHLINTSTIKTHNIKLLQRVLF